MKRFVVPILAALALVPSIAACGPNRCQPGYVRDGDGADADECERDANGNGIGDDDETVAPSSSRTASQRPGGPIKITISPRSTPRR